MKLLATIWMALLPVGFVCAAPSSERMEAAEELMTVMGVKESMAIGFDAMAPMIDQIAVEMRLTADEKKELGAIYKAWFDEDFDFPEIEQKIVLLYAEVFTTSELKELLAFYETPLGKKTLEVMPEIMQRSMELGMREAEANQQKLMNRLMPFFERVEKRHGG